MGEYDWISERAKCSLPAIFESLKSDVQEDIKKKNELDGDSPNAFYEVTVNAERIGVAYIARGTGTVDAVYFVLGKSAIEVRDVRNQVVLSAIPTLCDDGICRLKINGKECELWHLRKRALESLLFRN